MSGGGRNGAGAARPPSSEWLDVVVEGKPQGYGHLTELGVCAAVTAYAPEPATYAATIDEEN